MRVYTTVKSRTMDQNGILLAAESIGRFLESGMIRHRGGRQRKGEDSAVPQLALHPDLATMRVHDVLGNGKPQAGTTRLPRARLIHPVEALEDASLVLGGNPRAEVLHKELHPLVPLLRHAMTSPQTEASTAAAIFGRILHQVAEYLLQRVRIGHDD